MRDLFANRHAQRHFFSLRTWVYLLLLSLIAGGMMFYRLGGRMFVGDEGIYANVLDQMIETGDWNYLHTAPNAPLLDKPPLYFWLTTATVGMFEDRHVAYRFWSALFGFGAVLLVFVLGCRLFTPEVGLLGGLLLAGNKNFLLYHGARDVAMDSPLTFFALLSFVIYHWLHASRHRPVMWLALGLCTAAGCMFKPLFGLPFLAILALHHLLFDHHVAWPRRLVGPFIAGFICLLVILPWHLAQWFTHGDVFVEMYLTQNLFKRAATGLDPWHIRGPLFYWTNISASSPAFFFFVPSLLIAVAAIARNVHRQAFLFLLFGSLTFVGLMTLAKSKLAWYVYPVYPLIALLLAASVLLAASYAVTWFRSVPKRHWLYQSTVIVLLLAMCASCAYTMLRRIPRQSRQVYPPLQVYRQLEPALQNGKIRFVCYRFAKPDTTPDAARPFSESDIWYAGRMPLAVWVDDPRHLGAVLADARPTCVLLGQPQDIAEVQRQLPPQQALQFSHIGNSSRQYPVARNNATIQVRGATFAK